MSQRTSSAGAGLVYRLIMASDIPAFIGGQIYRGTRPNGSDQEDILIRPQSITTGSRQLQYVDVLAFVPDIKEVANTFTPDTLRLGEIASKIMSLFELNSGPAYTITVEENSDQNAIESINQHYAFFRLLLIIDELIETL